MAFDQSHNTHFNQAGVYVSPSVSGKQPSVVNPTSAESVGSVSRSCVCPNCQQLIETRVKQTNGALVWIVAIVIAVMGGICGCCLIPFCIKALKDTTHYCPNCASVIARQSKL